MTVVEPGSGLCLRPLATPDLARVMEIERACFSVPWQENTFASLMSRGDTDLIGAERDGRLVGYAVCWTTVDEAELGNVAVAPEARRSGTGETLVAAVVERVRRRGARACFLEVRESNTAAQALYRRLGFQTIGRRPRYYSRPLEDALVMRRRLASSG